MIFCYISCKIETFPVFKMKVWIIFNCVKIYITLKICNFNHFVCYCIVQYKFKLLCTKSPEFFHLAKQTISTKTQLSIFNLTIP